MTINIIPLPISPGWTYHPQLANNAKPSYSRKFSNGLSAEIVGTGNIPYRTSIIRPNGERTGPVRCFHNLKNAMIWAEQQANEMVGAI